jgi:hypothetical protein
VLFWQCRWHFFENHKTLYRDGLSFPDCSSDVINMDAPEMPELTRLTSLNRTTSQSYTSDSSGYYVRLNM